MDPGRELRISRLYLIYPTHRDGGPTVKYPCLKSAPVNTEQATEAQVWDFAPLQTFLSLSAIQNPCT